MFVSILLAIITAIFVGAVEFGLLYLFSDTMGFDMFDCFQKKNWKESPVSTFFKALLWLIAILFLVGAVASVFMGEMPFGDNAESEQWEPVL